MTADTLLPVRLAWDNYKLAEDRRLAMMRARGMMSGKPIIDRSPEMLAAERAEAAAFRTYLRAWEQADPDGYREQEEHLAANGSPALASRYTVPTQLDGVTHIWGVQ